MAASTKVPEEAHAAYRARPAQSVAHKFNVLASTWRRETALQSSVTTLAMHPAYQQIIGLGEPALPLIFQELRREPDHWFWALQAITGENPVSEENAGDLEAMASDWLAWAKAHDYL